MRSLHKGFTFVIIRLNGKATFSNMYNLRMKELVIVASIVIIRLNENVAFSNMYNLCMKELLIVVSIVTIRLNKKVTFSDMLLTVYNIMHLISYYVFSKNVHGTN